MPARNWRMRVDDILDAIANVERYTSGMSFEQFSADDKTAGAVLWSFVIIGEAANRVPDEVQARYPAIPWARMRGMRNVLIHDYPRVNLAIVWATARNDLPPLTPLLRDLLRRGP